MDDIPENRILLERIASALERIAACLEENSRSRGEPDTNSPVAPVILEPGATRLVVSILPEQSNDAATATIAPESEEPEPVSSVQDITKLKEFLAVRNITLKSLQAESASDEILDKLALFIGKRFETVRTILDLIKSNMNSGIGFGLNLKNMSQQSVADITNLCTNLYSIAFLTAYRYQKSPSFQLYATPSTSPRALNFFSGQWLERFVKTQVVALAQSAALQFSYICNAQIALPNGDDFELDMLFEAAGEVFWLEAKSGDYQRHIEKYSKMAKVMGLNRSHTLMVLADARIDDNIARTLSNLFNMTVVRIDKFAENLAQVLPQKTVDPPQPEFLHDIVLQDGDLQAGDGTIQNEILQDETTENEATDSGEL